MTSSRQLVSSGSPLEPEIGFSRAVRSGPYVCVAGTAPIAEGGGTAAPGDVYAQSVRCLDIAEQALQEADRLGLAHRLRQRSCTTSSSTSASWDSICSFEGEPLSAYRLLPGAVLRQGAVGQAPVGACLVHGELGFDGILQVNAGHLSEAQ